MTAPRSPRVPTARTAATVVGLAWMLAGCAGPALAPAPAPAPTFTPVSAFAPAPGPGVPQTRAAAAASAADGYPWLNRLTWGASPGDAARHGPAGLAAYLDTQLQPAPAVRLPPAAESQIAALTLSQRAPAELALAMEQQRKAIDAITDDGQKKAAQSAYQQEMTRLAREAATRHVLRALYSPAQVQEQMTWFWLNHFSVFQNKSNLRVLLGDYEDGAVRPHALGRFRDLLGAVALHPAMLRYLDNDQNAARRLNENFARELMELHTLGVDGGYSQADVQELARVLTGAGVNLGGDMPRLNTAQQAQYVRRGVFEFNPARHDNAPKQLLGAPLTRQGLGEIDEALDRLARHPATARHLSRKLAAYWLADEPPPALVERMAARFTASDGDIAATLRTLFTAPEFAQGAGGKFKDPMRYVIGAVRLAYDDRVILNAGPVLGWLSRLGEPLYGRQTPDGYPLDQSAWASPGQMATRFEIARAIGSSHAGLFRTEEPERQERPAFPMLANPLFWTGIQPTLGAATRQALDQAASPQEWNTLVLAAPEMMMR